jgi:hypothetical protein
VKGAHRLWVLIVVAGVVAVVVANVALLGLASERNDPVGRLEPVATLDVPSSTATTPVSTTPAGTTTGSSEPNDDNSGPGSGKDVPDD